jgi:putative redox protein
MSGKTTEITALWKGGLEFEAANTQGASVRMAPPSENPSLAPMELVLIALAGCTGMDTADILRKKRQAVETLEVRVRGTRTEDHPRVYAGIEVEYILSGKDLQEEAVARAIELSTTKYCSVGAMLSPSVPIRTSYRIVPGKEAAP